MSIVEEKWAEIIEHLRLEHELSNISFTTWIQPLKVYDIINGTVFILVNMNASVEYIEKKYLLPLKVSIAEVTGEEYEVIFISEDDEKIHEIKNMSLESNQKKRSKSLSEKAGLNPKYTFDTFVVGGNNNFAHAASLAVAESPGEVYNPLFLYGGVGLGKTHLMHSIAHFILNNNSKKKVLYVTSEVFTNELITALRMGKTEGNARLRTRFEWGLIADISSPDYETRMAILQKKIELDNLEKYNISTDVLDYIAGNIKSNIRELEGSLNKLIALYKLNNNHNPIDISLAAEALKDIISAENRREITPQLILDIVADHFGITVTDLKSNKRNAEIAIPRQICMYLMRNMTDTALKGIGIMLGGKDHSTIKYGSEKIASEIEKDETLANTINIIKKKINPA